ncbi:MAG: hypothetical protein CM15mP85_27700 [Rhodobacterales bacterium]|nr:MAG: hypothetical protein CM15mP85_27700 [Rhodobacterales bacterium]
MVSKHLDYNSVDIKKAARFSVAPMMDWTIDIADIFTENLQKITFIY